MSIRRQDLRSVREGRVLRNVGLVLLVLSLAAGFLVGYEIDALFGLSTPGWMQQFLIIGQWVLLGLSAVLLVTSDSLRTDVLKTGGYFQDPRLMGTPVGLLLIALGTGILVSSAETDTVDGWIYVGTGIIIVVGVELVRPWAKRGMTERATVLRDGSDVQGTVVKTRHYVSSDNDVSKVTVRFTDIHTLRDIETVQTVRGHVPMGATYTVRYNPQSPEMKPVLTVC